MSTTDLPAPARTTIWAVMRRPRWIATLVLALAVAGGFAALGQWQLERAVTTGADTGNTSTETVKPLQDVAAPQTPVLESQAGQRVEVEGHFVASGFDVLGDRLDQGRPGYWVIGQFAVAGKPDSSLAVALGWTADGSAAVAAAEALAAAGDTPVETLTGRYLPTEAPVLADLEEPADGIRSLDGSPLQSSLAVAALVNRWAEFDDAAVVYGGYLVDSAAPPGLTAIDSPEPDSSVQLNWLNVFYAVEWVVFAGFAIYLWYRLVRDAWERENDAEDDGDDPDAGGAGRPGAGGADALGARG